MRFLILPVYFIIFTVQCQNVNVNNDYNYSMLRYSSISGSLDTDLSFNIKPVKFNNDLSELLANNYRNIFSNTKKSIELKSLGIDYFIEYNTHHPYNRNNGTMIPNRGYQHIISPGIFLKIGPLSIQFKPEHHYSENRDYDGFWEGHYPVVWADRYRLWNAIDMPERFGEKRHNQTTFGQSSVKLNWKNLSIGVSNENIWWGPSIRNSIMMSNHAQGFKHITVNTNNPIKSFVGNFEFQFVTGRLESSTYLPPRTDYEYAGNKLYVPKIAQNGWTNDWRYFQGIVLSYSPKWIEGLSLGFIKWTQMYSALLRGQYTWMPGEPTYFPLFSNLFRKNDKFVDYELQTDQAAGLFFKWIFIKSRSEIYAEYHFNDAKQNLRDLLLDPDHSRAATFGLQKIFKISKEDFLFNWEWTQMEQTASRILRNTGSWYEHAFVYHGYTNRGEVLGSSIGPGSNSHYFSLNRIKSNEKIGVGFEIIDHDNDFYYESFANARDYRRYWKDFNLHINFNKMFKNFSISSNLVLIRSLNYQWEHDDSQEPYYAPGRDVNNLHINLKFTYFGLSK